jgi:phosphatidylglycerol:prolipoprotein diacylglycerol transferase
LEIFAVWQGGMSFHGGFGVLVAMWLFSRRYRKDWLTTMDFLAPLVPPGLAPVGWVTSSMESFDE